VLGKVCRLPRHESRNPGAQVLSLAPAAWLQRGTQCFLFPFCCPAAVKQMLKWILQNQARLHLTLSIFGVLCFFVMKERRKSKRKYRQDKKGKREILPKCPCPPQKNKHHQDKSFTGPRESPGRSGGPRSGGMGVKAAGGPGWRWYRWYRRDRARQGGFAADSCTKQRWKRVELGFAVLCWELLGGFPIAALFRAAGFYTSSSSWETNSGKTAKMCFFPHEFCQTL